MAIKRSRRHRRPHRTGRSPAEYFLAALGLLLLLAVVAVLATPSSCYHPQTDVGSPSPSRGN